MNISLEAFLTLVVVSGFVRMLLALSILRYGLGLGAVEGGILALVVSGVLAISALHTAYPNMTISELVAKTEKSELLKTDQNPASPDSTLNKALTHELRKGLEVGVVLLIPFVIVDLLAAHLLILLGITQIPAAVLSIPLKFLLFLAVDGWALLSAKLLAGT